MSDFLVRAYELDPAVALRDETFGALAYHFGTRRLTFLKTRELTHVVRLLASTTDVAAALSQAGIDREQWDAYGRALDQLASAGMIRRRERVTAA